MPTATRPRDEQTTADAQLVRRQVGAQRLRELGMRRDDPRVPAGPVLEVPLLAARASVRPRCT